MLFDFFSMAYNYEERKVARFEKGGLIVDTCAVTDSDEPFETGITHPRYNDGKWVIVETYISKSAAELGHARWVKKMTAKTLPKELADVSTAETAKLAIAFGDKNRIRKIQSKKEKPCPTQKH